MPTDTTTTMIEPVGLSSPAPRGAKPRTTAPPMIAATIVASIERLPSSDQ